jgi:hypothetical protein
MYLFFLIYITMDSKLNIGITICLKEENESVWTNGIKLNALYLARTFMNSKKKYNVYIVNTSNVKITDKLGWDINKYKTVQLNDVKDKLDIIFPLGGILDKMWTEYFRRKGCKVVPYKCGNEYVISMENVIFGRSDNTLTYTEVDQVWYVPQHTNTNHYYWETLYRTDAISIPFVWNSMFLDDHIKELKKNGDPFYKPSKNKKRISILDKYNSDNMVNVKKYDKLIEKLIS